MGHADWNSAAADLAAYREGSMAVAARCWTAHTGSVALLVALNWGDQQTAWNRSIARAVGIDRDDDGRG